ncbi:MAG: LysR family transcriptional regulator [Rhodobacteraceae bacterium]|nr:LysR family transcriptional regulator [Paracoccaceae bacterium]
MDWRSLPPLSSLRAFAAYAETGNLTAAADALGVSHPAISQHIRALEAHFGTALMIRGGRSMTLTPEGEMLARAAQEGFGLMIQAAQALTGYDQDRPLHITATPSFAAAWLMPRLAEFRDLHPDVGIMINPTPHIVTLEPGGVDVAIRHGTGGWAGLDEEMLIASPLVLVGAPSLARKLIGKPYTEFANVPWLEEIGRTEAQNWLEARGANLTRQGPVLRVPGNLLLDGARDGQGLAVTVRCFVEADLAADRLMLLDQADLEGAGYYVVTRPGAMRAPLKAFVKWIKRAAAEAHGEPSS